MGVKMEDYLFSSGVFPFLAQVALVWKRFPFLLHFRFVTRVKKRNVAQQISCYILFHWIKS
jgi:hypothetical protein